MTKYHQVTILHGNLTYNLEISFFKVDLSSEMLQVSFPLWILFKFLTRFSFFISRPGTRPRHAPQSEPQRHAVAERSVAGKVSDGQRLECHATGWQETQAGRHKHSCCAKEAQGTSSNFNLALTMLISRFLGNMFVATPLVESARLQLEIRSENAGKNFFLLDWGFFMNFEQSTLHAWSELLKLRIC